MNLVLIGYRASGKSAVGRRLGERLNREFVDIDDLIEKQEGGPISDIVQTHGWEYFREVEKKMIRDVSSRSRLIMAPGGGAVLDEENVNSLKENGLVIWLKAEKQVLLRRMDKDPDTSTRRPSLTGKGTLDELQEVMTKRKAYYEKAADVEFDTSTFDVDGVVEKILSILPRGMGE
jgi:shikimate kinase